ncbi:hypothetical protein [Caldovatus aquaticus]|uniref:Uncharacterized protein n=1 Tax=Caldovatus aquaticus TaxID=2865671 RepID=A0ABS7F1X9_9PROT|nr:hypothetical protein [Caldovatus aquaticus]MBW8268987.1 hypothetical protein [Caldovatus aquaticus]
MEIEARAARLRAAARCGETDGSAAWREVLALRRDAALRALDAARAGTPLARASGHLRSPAVARRRREAAFVGVLSPSPQHIGHELARLDAAGR